MEKGGQIVIPKDAREIFGIHPGDTLKVLGDEKRGITLVKGRQVSYPGGENVENIWEEFKEHRTGGVICRYVS